LAGGNGASAPKTPAATAVGTSAPVKTNKAAVKAATEKK